MRPKHTIDFKYKCSFTGSPIWQNKTWWNVVYFPPDDKAFFFLEWDEKSTLFPLCDRDVKLTAILTVRTTSNTLLNRCRRAQNRSHHNRRLPSHHALFRSRG